MVLLKDSSSRRYSQNKFYLNPKLTNPSQSPTLRWHNTVRSQTILFATEYLQKLGPIYWFFEKVSKEFWKSKTDNHCAEWATLLTNTARSQKIKLFQNPTSNLASRWWQSWWLLSLTRLIDHMVRVGGILSAKGRCCWLGVGNDSMPCRTTYLEKRMNIQYRSTEWMIIYHT